ncbi:MAG: DUF4249 domain-containing protein [Bacteroidetes bacterium]|nr:DUF4249 domain-containing protein [Bacteroidota bacterium]
MKQVLKYILILPVIAVLFSACEQIVDLQVPESDPLLVVEAAISNDSVPFRVKLSLSQPYFNQDERTYVDDAQVIISGSNGTIDTLYHQDTGTYSTKTVRWCVVGETYTLSIRYKGKTYTSSEKCKFQEPIDFLMSFYLPDQNGFIEPGYYVFEKAGESEAVGDYYFWKIYRNDSLINEFGYLLDEDEFRETSFFNLNIDPDDPLKDMDKNILPRPFPFKFDPNDHVRVEQYNISQGYYDFLNELQTQVSRSGAPFDPPPVNPNFNISNGAIGYFSVSNVSRDTLTIVE